MHILFATDIFGATTWTERLVGTWLEQGYDVTLVSPYETQQNFTGEAQAYKQFLAMGGFEEYCCKLNSAINKVLQDSTTVFIGFSAGGAGLWKVISENSVPKSSHLIAFYPGQIRQYLDLTPNTEVTIVQPAKEQHFDLKAVIEHLVTKPNVTLVQNTLRHGYANPSSEGYNEAASEELFNLLTQTIIYQEAEQFSQALTQFSHKHVTI